MFGNTYGPESERVLQRSMKKDHEYKEKSRTRVIYAVYYTKEK